jgi:hypothetical protein
MIRKKNFLLMTHLVESGCVDPALGGGGFLIGFPAPNDKFMTFLAVFCSSGGFILLIFELFSSPLPTCN